MIGIQGAQGTGKTVLTILMKIFLQAVGYAVDRASLDDFYKTFEERKVMKEGAYAGNPFYDVRGVPGTHSFEELYTSFGNIRNGHEANIPIFDKSKHNGKGDRIGYRQVKTPLDIWIFEGWCVGVPQVDPSQFPSIMQENEYAKKVFEGLDPRHEHYQKVLEHIEKYQKIWSFLDDWTVMQPINIRSIESWRQDQERRTIATKGSGMTPEEVSIFIRPYIPITWLIYHHIQRNKPNCIITVGEDHLPTKFDYAQTLNDIIRPER